MFPQGNVVVPIRCSSCSHKVTLSFPQVDFVVSTTSLALALLVLSADAHDLEHPHTRAFPEIGGMRPFL